MSLRRVLVALAVVALAAPAASRAQGLGDTAAREREKRAKEPKDDKADPARAYVYTNEDLEEGRPPGETRNEPSAAAGTSAYRSSSSRSREESDSGSERGGDQRQQLEALKEAQARVSSLEARIREAGSKLNPMSTDYIFGASGSNNPNEELQVRQELSSLQAQLTAARQELARANEGLTRPAPSSEAQEYDEGEGSDDPE